MPGEFASRSAGDLSCLDAGGTDVQPLRGAVDLRAHALNVRVEAARGAAVRERHVVAEARSLAAHVADGSHGIAPLGVVKWVKPAAIQRLSRLRISDLAPVCDLETLTEGRRIVSLGRQVQASPDRTGDAALMAKLTDGLRTVVGDKAAKRLATLGSTGLRTVGDLLTYYPRRYETRGQLTDLASLRDGEHVTVQAEIASVHMRPMRNRQGSIFEAVVTDGQGKLTLTFFGRGRQDWRERDLAPGRTGLFSGQVSSFRGKRQLSHPEYELLPDSGESSEARAAEFASEIIPIYPASKDISSWQIADSVRLALAAADIDSDPLPAFVKARHGLYDYARALRAIHHPADDADKYRAISRLKWDEAFMLQVVLEQRRRVSTEYVALPRPGVPGGLLAEFDQRLPFTLTSGQQAAGEVIADDLAQGHPMHRLLQGEVGSGKTIVALRAMLQVIDSAGQAALLAPTEVLAQQHYRSISQMLGPLAMAGQLGGAEQATTISLLTGSQGSAVRRRALLEAASGSAGIVVGTHALLEDQVQFADLGLIIIDEQHRFGVEQREALRAKAVTGRPHVLVMTATPIPRTVAMTVFGDLEVTELTELPAGRSPIDTHVVPVD